MFLKKMKQEELDAITKNLPKAVEEEERQEILDSVFIKIKEYLNTRIDELSAIIDKFDEEKSLDLIANQIQSKIAYQDLLVYIEILHREFVEQMTYERLQSAFNKFYKELVLVDNVNNEEKPNSNDLDLNKNQLTEEF